MAEAVRGLCYRIVEPYQNVTVTANITDAESEIREAILSYTTDEGKTWTNITMINITNDVYQAKIPGFPAGTHAKYKIARDKTKFSAVKSFSRIALERRLRFCEGSLM